MTQLQQHQIIKNIEQLNRYTIKASQVVKPGTSPSANAIKTYEYIWVIDGRTLDRKENPLIMLECNMDGPILPHKNKIGVADVGPKRPCIKLIFNTLTDGNYPLFEAFIHKLHCAAAVFSHNIKIPDNCLDLVAVKEGEFYVPKFRCKDGQIQSFTQDKTFNFMGIPGMNFFDIKENKTVFNLRLGPHIYQKTNTVYVDMDLKHRFIPNATQNAYRKADTELDPSANSIEFWQISIPVLQQQPDGVYKIVKGQNYAADPKCTPVISSHMHNGFYGIVQFKTNIFFPVTQTLKISDWLEANVSFIKSNAAYGDRNLFGFDEIEANAGTIVQGVDIDADEESPSSTQIKEFRRGQFPKPIQIR